MEYGEFEWVGGNKIVKIDVCLVVVINEDFFVLVDVGEFWVDFFDCLVFDVIIIFFLREWLEDIMMLVENFVINMVREFEMELFSGFIECVKWIFMEYDWSGNIREFKNVVECVVYCINNFYLFVYEIVFDFFEFIYCFKFCVKIYDWISSIDEVFRIIY